ncbi:MAG: restriction endonuclease [Vitreimonas sp.]
MSETYRLHDPIKPSAVRYIKLGPGGVFATPCIDAGVVALAFDAIPHDLCVASDWDRVRQLFLDDGKGSARANDHVRELRAFYELGPETLWITFAEGLLWWTFAEAEVVWDDAAKGRLPRRRKTIGGWRSTNTSGEALRASGLSTRLTRVSAYRSTICSVEDVDYLIAKLSSQEIPLISEAVAARDALTEIAVKLIQRLHEKEFELLVDLIFANSGWRRVSVLGETEKDVDLLVEQIATNERAFVQVKSSATPAVLDDYIERFRAYPGVDRMVFACHSPSPALIARAAAATERVDLWLADTLAQKAVRAGLFDWLIEQAR